MICWTDPDPTDLIRIPVRPDPTDPDPKPGTDEDPKRDPDPVKPKDWMKIFPRGKIGFVSLPVYQQKIF